MRYQVTVLSSPSLSFWVNCKKMHNIGCDTVKFYGGSAIKLNFRDVSVFDQ